MTIYRTKVLLLSMLGTRIRRIRMFLGLPDPDPDPLVRRMIRIRIILSLGKKSFLTSFDFLSFKNYLLLAS
jgi:hypothetical protein